MIAEAWRKSVRVMLLLDLQQTKQNTRFRGLVPVVGWTLDSQYQASVMFPMAHNALNRCSFSCSRSLRSVTRYVRQIWYVLCLL